MQLCETSPRFPPNAPIFQKKKRKPVKKVGLGLQGPYEALKRHIRPFLKNEIPPTTTLGALGPNMALYGPLWRLIAPWEVLLPD